MKCEKCNNEHDGSFGSGRFCSRSCANSCGSKSVDYSKVSETMKTHSSWYKDGRSKIQCKVCGKEIQRNKTGFCIKHLPIKSEEYRKKISEACKGKGGGFRVGSVRGIHGVYNGFYFDSSWELAWMIVNTENGITFERNTEGFGYIHNGEKHKFYPDFKQNGIYIEIKGIKSESFNSKLRYFPNKIRVLYREDIVPYLIYCKEKYGKRFWEVWSKS